MPVLKRSALAGVSALALVAAGAATLLPKPAHAVDLASNIVISEVYGGGGNTGAQYQNDFVELYNHGTAAQSVAGWSVQYADRHRPRRRVLPGRRGRRGRHRRRAAHPE